MTYSPDFRKKVLAVRQQEKLSIRATAKRFVIGVATVTRWVKDPKIHPCLSRQRKLDKQALLKDVELYPDAYQYERAERFSVSPKAIWQALKKLGITYKKNTEPSKGRPKRTACISADYTDV